ncbi:MAG: tRNA epoxyqueuosine(34) reductase QueG [Parvularculaceae bacterium]
MDGAKLKQAIFERAASEGFDACGVAAPDAIADAPARLRAFLAEGRHGEMAWMARRVEERADPRKLWPETRAVIMLGFNYGPAEDPLRLLAETRRGAVSCYAQGSDYHDVVKKKLKRIARWIVETCGGEVKVFIDTAPVMEKPLAQAAGLGWQGKHSNLVSRARGSWLFLGAIFTTLDLPPDATETDHCGQCRRCLEICPTDAFPAPYQLDARRCISYLTIEHKGHIPREFRAAIGNRIYGCDDCLAVCPWNKFAQKAREAALFPRPETAAPALCDLVDLDDAAFRRIFAGSPVKRTGRDRFLRNVLIAIGNSGEASLADAAAARLDDASPLVRAAAVWALARLMPAAEFAALRRKRAGRERDETVAEEWRIAAPDGQDRHDERRG